MHISEYRILIFCCISPKVTENGDGRINVRKNVTEPRGVFRWNFEGLFIHARFRIFLARSAEWRKLFETLIVCHCCRQYQLATVSIVYPSWYVYGVPSFCSDDPIQPAHPSPAGFNSQAVLPLAHCVAAAKTGRGGRETSIWVISVVV